jgi:hypothetical protein
MFKFTTKKNDNKSKKDNTVKVTVKGLGGKKQTIVCRKEDVKTF